LKRFYFFTTKTKIMRMYLKLPGYSLFFLTVILFMASCNNGGDEKKAAENSVADTSKKAPEMSQEQPKAKAMSIAGYLDYLYIPAAEFMNLPKANLVFSFAFRTNDTLTLYGWSCDAPVGICTGKYRDSPNIKLEKGKPTGIAYGPEVYFGNIVVQKKGVKDIQDKFPGYKYVVFVPVNNGGFITYEINVTNDPPNPPDIKALALTTTGIIANPSPPKDY